MAAVIENTADEDHRLEGYPNHMRWEKVIRLAQETSNVVKHIDIKNISETDLEWVGYLEPQTPKCALAVFQALFGLRNKEQEIIRLLIRCTDNFPKMLSRDIFSLALRAQGRSMRMKKCR